MTAEAESDLVACAVGGDNPALERLLLKYSDRLSRRIARKLPGDLRSVVDEDDILQQAFIDAFRRIHDFQPRRRMAFYFWLATIADHRLMDAVKAHRTAKRGGGRDLRRSPGVASDSSVDDLIELLPGPNRTPSQSVARHEAVQAVRVGLASLKDEYRRVIDLRYVQGLSVDETAERMQKTTAAVKNLCRRGLAELNAAVGRSTEFLSSR